VGHWRNDNTPAETTSRRAGAQQWNSGFEGPAYRLAASCLEERTGSSVGEEGGDGLLWSAPAGRPKECLPGWPLTLFCLLKRSSRRFSATYSAVWLVARSSGRPSSVRGAKPVVRLLNCFFDAPHYTQLLGARVAAPSYGLGARVAAPSCWKRKAAVGGHCTRERHRLHQPWQGAGDVPRRLPFFNEIHAAGQIKQMAPQCWLHLRLCAVLRQLDWRESALADLLAPQKTCSNAKCSLWIAPIVASTLVPSLADVP